MDLRRWSRLFFLSGAIFALLIFFLFVRFFHPQGSQAPVDQGFEDFLKAHWQRPIPLQGEPPASFSEAEASLRPEACGKCHAKQYADWQESLHGKAMGPGPWGQIIDLIRNSPEEAAFCMTCHAPLSEQSPFLANGEENPRFDAELQLRGITCAACHVRGHRRYGPPKAEGVNATRYPAGMADHGGVERTPYFERAEFCRDCHQFDPENTPLVNGKPLQDTYREWQESIWGKGEAACQECHMPNRRHLWRGIHDAEWVRGGVHVEARLNEASPKSAGPWELAVVVVNSAVGHKFPTYSTPKLFARAGLLDQGGKLLSGTLREKIIGWDARFENGEWKEYFDTRIAPGEKFQSIFRWTRSGQAKAIRAWVEVDPDHFYRVHFYPAYLKSGDLSSEGRRLVEQALREASRSVYILFDKTIPLGEPSS